MDYASYYRQFEANCELMGCDEFYEDGENPDDPGALFRRFTDQQMIDMAVAGAGVKGVGEEVARRGLLDRVPGDHWGE